MTTNVYEDERYIANEEERKAAVSDNNETYDKMINDSQKFYDDQIAEADRSAEEQKALQQQQTDFALEKIKQQKEQTQQDYIKEQKGAYGDWKKQSNEYGAQAEQIAAQGLAQTGFSESSQVGMWNTYQNRVASARASVERAKTEYDNMMKEAMLQNSSALAQIAADTFTKKAAIALEGFQYRNDLLLQRENHNMQIQNLYESRGQSIIDQINYEEQMKYQQEQDRIANERYERELKIKENQAQAELEMYGFEFDEDGNMLEKTYAVSTPYYQGDLNPDANEYGTFNNEYQPKGISGHGELHKSGKTENIETMYMYGPNAGQSVIVPQNVWEAEDGTLWLWDGRNNEYVPYEEEDSSTANTNAGDSLNNSTKTTQKTDYYFDNGYQPRYINNKKLKSVGTIANTIGSYGKIPKSQNVWKAGNQYYVWDGSTRTYKNVTDEYWDWEHHGIKQG